MANKKKKSSGNANAARAARPQRNAAPAKKGMSATAQWGIIAAIGVLIVGAIVFNGVRDAADDGGPGVVAAEAFDLPNLEDQDNPDDRVRLADFEGTPTVVNFFASWCTACDEELPDFRETALALEVRSTSSSSTRTRPATGSQWLHGTRSSGSHSLKTFKASLAMGSIETSVERAVCQSLRSTTRAGTSSKQR